jgi:hypothetical protein
MADYFMAREFFYKLSWPKSNQNDFKEPQKFYRGAMLAAAQLLDGGPMLMDAYSAVSKSSTERLKHLSKQRQALAQNEHVGQMVLADRGYVPGVGFVPYEGLLLEAEALEPEDEEEAMPAQEVVISDELSPEQEAELDRRSGNYPFSADSIRKGMGAPHNPNPNNAIRHHEGTKASRQILEQVSQPGAKERREEEVRQQQSAEVLKLLREPIPKPDTQTSGKEQLPLEYN